MTREPHVALYLGEAEIFVYRSATLEKSAVEYCSDTAVSMRNGRLVCGNDGGAEAFPFRYIDDELMLVGAHVMSTASVYECIINAALNGVGVHRGAVANVVEVGFPTHWGSARRNRIRDAVRPMAREVVFVAAAVASAMALGERASGKSVVVELSGLASTITQVDRSSAATRLGPCVLYTDTGTRDVASAPLRVGSVMDRAEEIATGQGADQIILGTTAPAPDSGHSASSIHFIGGRDIVRGLATGNPADADVRRAPASVPLDVRTMSESTRSVATSQAAIRSSVGRSDGAGRARMPVRSAQWLNSGTPISPSRRSRALPLAVLAAIGVIAGAAVIVAIWRGGAQEPQAGTSAHTERESPRQLAPTTPAAQSPHDPVALETPPSTPVSASVSRAEDVWFERDRVSVRLPPGWQVKENAARLELQPMNAAPMKIVVVQRPLGAGADIERVADSVSQLIADRRGEGVFSDFQRAVDVGGRVGVAYTETPTGGSIVHWTVFAIDGVQVSVGCQFAPSTITDIDAACRSAVESVAVSSP